MQRLGSLVLLDFVRQARGTSSDVEFSLGPSAVRPTRTGVVLLKKDLHEEIAAKLRRAPEHDREDACRLLLHLLRIADARRCASHCLGSCHLWWHRDLSRAEEVDAIRAAWGTGRIWIGSLRISGPRRRVQDPDGRNSPADAARELSMRSLALASLAIAFPAAAASAQCTIYGSPGGSGCGSSTPWGIPTIRCMGAPTVGNQSYAIEANIPCQTAAPVLFLGGCLPTPYRIPGPFGAGGFCGPTEATCLLFVGPSIHAGILGVSSTPPNGFRFALPIPADPALRGAIVCAQMFTFCATTGGACLGASHGLFLQVQ